MFAVAVLSPDSDLLLSIVVEFATAGEVSRETISSDIAKALMENIQTLNSRAFDSDEMLFKELTCLDHSGTRGVGVPLISKESPLFMINHRSSLFLAGYADPFRFQSGYLLQSYVFLSVESYHYIQLLSHLCFRSRFSSQVFHLELTSNNALCLAVY